MRLLSVFLTLLLGAAVAARPAAAQDRHVDERRPLERDGYFRIWNPEGSVRVTAWDRDTVWVRGTLSPASRVDFHFGASGPSGKMAVQSRGEGARADFEVVVPRGATVWIKTTGGAIEVAGVRGGVDAYSVTGDVRVGGSPRTVFAESMGGAVRLEGQPASARAKTGQGAIQFRGSSPDLALSTVAGDIVVDTDAVRRGILESVSGAVRFQGRLERGGALTVQSHDGAVELAFPPDQDADFVLNTLEGAVTDGLIGGRVTKTTGLRGREVTLTAGDGGAEVRVRTFSGDIRLRRAEALAERPR